LLGTIKVPKNLSLLAERLPKAQYNKFEEVEHYPEVLVESKDLKNLKKEVS
jgi:hypothetical protein